MDEQQREADRALEVVVARLLQAGVLLAAVIVTAGSLLVLWRHASDPTHYRTFHGEPQTLRSVNAIVSGAFAGDARALTQLGLLVLIATPVARVALAGIGFALERDRLYTGVAIVVLGLLALGLSGL